jgi:hypothetical protein
MTLSACLAVVVVGGTPTAVASVAHTNTYPSVSRVVTTPACGDVLFPTATSGSWMIPGGGVDVYSNGATDEGTDSDCSAQTSSVNGVTAGEEWQCVEFVNRLYLTRGWITGPQGGNRPAWPGSAGPTFYNDAPPNLTKQLNGLVTYLGPGDVVIIDVFRKGVPDGGHALVVNDISDVSSGTVDLVSQNGGYETNSEPVVSGSISGGFVTVGGGGKEWTYTTVGVVHAPTPTSPPAETIGTQLAELSGSDTVGNDSFGSSVAISGTTAVVGAPNAHTAGRAYIFSKTASGWKQVAELKGSDTVVGDDVGWSVAISGTTAVVGALEAHFAGRAYIFSKTAAGWKQVAELKGSGPLDQDGFGNSVAISGTTVIVGAPFQGAHGRAYIFSKTASGWKQVAELKGSDSTAAANFGGSVAISGTTAVVGSWHRCRAYVFTKTATGWKQVAELKGSDTVAYDEFGASVAISGSTALVSAPLHPHSAGRAYVFTKTASGWKQVAELKGYDTVAWDRFGWSVAISGSTALVSAPLHPRSAGRAYVFTKTATGWKQVAELKGSDTVASDDFGNSVAVSGTEAIVGAESLVRVYVFEA